MINLQGKDCYICKGSGHRAKDCPEKQKGSFVRSKVCLKCGDSGHDMFSCWNYYPDDDLKVFLHIISVFPYIYKVW